MLAHAIREAVSVDALDPPFENRGHREPPQWKLEEHGIGPEQLLLFELDILALQTHFQSALGVEGWIEARARFPRLPAVSLVEYRFPFHLVQIGNLHDVTGSLEVFDREVLERAR